MIFVLVYFRVLKKKPVMCKSDNTFLNDRICFSQDGKPLRGQSNVYLLTRRYEYFQPFLVRISGVDSKWGRPWPTL